MKLIRYAIFMLAIATMGVGGMYLAQHLNVDALKGKTLTAQGEFIPDQNIDVHSTNAFQQKDTLYTNFRQNFRFHFQTIGEATFKDGSAMLLISEPPPYFKADTIAQLFSEFTHTVEVKQHPVGYDGHIKDLVILLANVTRQNLNRLEKSLSSAVYLSDYKTNVTPLPVKHGRSYFVSQNIDYQITLYEFNEWFMEKDEQFFQLSDTSHTVTVEKMFADSLTGVYFSKVPGFVAWAIAKNHDLSEQLNHIRQFTLDADLVLGALSNSTTLVIIGRERETALYELPPLNVETILLLASVSKKELSQSLDINDFMVGKTCSGHDWCPTYLSKELENTEFGHLLTITDILLKNWSENGTIQEANYKYPTPPHYPFDRPLFKKLGLSELVYNWNTWNAMYAIDMDEGFTIYTLNRTGSLPVSYFNSPERSVSIGYRYENQAYNYFATLGNTDLARVVQYTALYQLFMDNKVTFSGKLGNIFPENKPYLLYSPTKNLLDFFKNLKSSQIDWLADTLSATIYKQYQKDLVNKQLKRAEKNYSFTYSDEQKTEIYNKVAKDERNTLRTEIAGIQSMLSNLNENEYRQLARYLAYPRGMQEAGLVNYTLASRGHRLNMLLRKIGKNNLSIIGLDLNSVKNFYVNSLTNASSPYLKTPSVIVTYNDMLTTGGHNLSAGITRVHSLTGYKRSSGGSGHYYPQAAPSGRQPQSNSSPSTKNNGNTGNSKSKSYNGVPKSTSTAKSGQNIRPRSEVISSNRTHRGY